MISKEPVVQCDNRFGAQLSRSDEVVFDMADLTALIEMADSLELVVENGLIQNTDPITRSEAAGKSTLWMLRWRYRVCQNTGQTFDITKKGFLYRSGDFE